MLEFLDKREIINILNEKPTVYTHLLRKNVYNRKGKCFQKGYGKKCQDLTESLKWKIHATYDIKNALVVLSRMVSTFKCHYSKRYVYVLQICNLGKI